jgi:DNA polymerase III epsilon subunit-like protein
MQEKKSDTFELSKATKRNFQSSNNFENFFLNQNKNTNVINYTNTDYSKRLNDYDLNLLQEHDALADALVTSMVFHYFKEYANKNQKTH